MSVVFQLWEVSSANEWKSIDVQGLFPEQSDGEQAEVTVKCSSWSANGERVICAAKNTVFVSPSLLWECVVVCVHVCVFTQVLIVNFIQSQSIHAI